MITTTQANLGTHLQSIPWASLSKTYQNAIDFTKFLGCRYLWIDSLCIIQDSTDDWEHEAANMAYIYSESYLNIAATQSSKLNDGLFN
ncbi:HET-domain-containing protein [Stipitochalara longipes BDJ]|nr:HET-domain-containing protein [Stipitochalara longipes BDJ]